MLRIVLVVAIVFVVYRFLAGRGSGRSRSGFKCATCRHCKALFDDGALCRYGDRETYKNPVHISNCTDYQSGRSRV